MTVLKGRDSEGGGKITPRVSAASAAPSRVRDAEKLASGWVKDETGNWIPPG